MSAPKRLLWVDDGGHDDFRYLSSSLLRFSDISCQIVPGPEEALNALVDREFDRIAVDLRLLPRRSPVWQRVYAEYRDPQPLLGVDLIATILGSTASKVDFRGELKPEQRKRLRWITPDVIAVLTVESKVSARRLVQDFGVRRVYSKNEDYDSRTEADNPLLRRIALNGAALL